MPVTPDFEIDAKKPCSSDQMLDPITRNRGSLVIGLICTLSIAPGAALCPEEI